jgi:hypothetical protein
MIDSDISFRRDSVARALKADDDRRKAEIDNFKPKDTKRIMEMFGSKSARQAILEQAYGTKSNPPKSRMKSQDAERAGIFKFKPVFHSKSGGEGARSRRPTNEVNNNAY